MKELKLQDLGLTQNTLNILANFISEELGVKVADGITYVIITSDSANYKSNLELLKLLEEEMGKEKYELFIKTLQVRGASKGTTGLVIDMNRELVRLVTTYIAQAMNVKLTILDTAPIQRKQEDLIRLANLLEKEMKSGKNEVCIALYSKNIVPNVTTTGKDQKGNDVQLKLPAFALRHYELQEVAPLIAQKSINMTSVQCGGVFPSKTGVSFKLICSKR